jgi:hypothetical protein
MRSHLSNKFFSTHDNESNKKLKLMSGPDLLTLKIISKAAMENTANQILDDDTIESLGLILTASPLTAEISHPGRVFEYPHLKGVYIMESDLYGNPMPEGSCFLAFNGTHGLMGEHLKIQTLKTSTPEEIRSRVEKEQEG